MIAPGYSGERGWLALERIYKYPSALQALALVIHHHCSDDALEPRGDRGCAAKLVARKSEHTAGPWKLSTSILSLYKEAARAPQSGAQTFTECQPYRSHRGAMLDDARR